MVSLAVEEVGKGTGRLSGAGNSGRGWLEGGGQRRRALPGSAPRNGCIGSAGFSLGLSAGIGGGPEVRPTRANIRWRPMTIFQVGRGLVWASQGFGQGLGLPQATIGRRIGMRSL